jgi:hypothetical protein
VREADHDLPHHRLLRRSHRRLLRHYNHGDISDQPEELTMTEKRTAKLNEEPRESEEQRNLRRSNAFRDLETPIFELYLQAEIAAEVAVGQHEDQSELALFAVYRFGEMARDLRAKYLATD